MRQPASPAPVPTARAQSSAVRLGRVLCAAGALIALSSIANAYLYLRIDAWNTGGGSLQNGPIQELFALLVLNSALGRWWPRYALSRAELLLVYVMLICALALVGNAWEFLPPVIAYPFYMATPENDWQGFLWHHIPLWTRPNGPQAVTSFWEGLPEGAGFPWSAWTQPVLAWSGFTAMLLCVSFCLAALLRKDWIEHQRLTFPLVEVPLSMVGDQPFPSLRDSGMRSGPFWVGFALPGSLALLRLLHELFPAVPTVDLWTLPIGRAFSGMGLPWSVLSDMTFTLYFPVLGIMCLLSSEVVLSLWLFWLIFIVWKLIWASFGITREGGAAAVDPAGLFSIAEAGGAVAFAGMLIYQSRDHIASAWRNRRAAASEEFHTPMGATAAAVGLLLATLGMLCFGLKLGMSWWAAIVMVAWCYVVLVTVSRLVVAAGVTWIHMGFEMRPFLTRVIGRQLIAPGTLTALTFVNEVYLNNPSNAVMPQMLNGFKLSHPGAIRGKTIGGAIAAGLVMALLVDPLVNLKVIYHFGANGLREWPVNYVGAEAFLGLDADLKSWEPASNWMRVAMVAGGLVMVGLAWLNTHALWWPVSPIGFLIASGWSTTHVLWVPAVIAWVAMGLVKRFGGLRLYHRLRPMFFGMILGEYLPEGIVGIVRTALQWHSLR